MSHCIDCGTELRQNAKFCVTCGRVGSPGTASSTIASTSAAFNYDEFGFCPTCDAVNLITVHKCRRCSASVSMAPLPGKFVGSKEFWGYIVVGIIGLFFVAPGLLVLGRTVILIRQRATEYEEARGRIAERASYLFDGLKKEQTFKAKREFEQAVSAFNAGRWKEAHELFVNSIVLAAAPDPEQALGAAVTAYNLGEYKTALEYANKVNGTRLDVITELKARCYLQLDDLKWDEIDFLMTACATFTPGLHDHVALAVVRWWLKAPILQERIETFLMLSYHEQPRTIEYPEALARYRMSQGRDSDALAICACIPDDDHTEGSLTVYCEVLRSRNEDSSRSFATLQRFWADRPDNIENSVYLAKLCIGRKDIGLAEAVIRRAFESMPDDPRLRYHLALVLRMAGRTEECLAELQQLLRIPESETYRSRDDVRLLMAKCLMESNVDDAAVRQLQGMVRTSAVLELLYDLGVKYSAASKIEKARECWADIYAVDVRYKDVSTRILTTA